MILVFLSNVVLAGENVESHKKKALEGYDPVSYFSGSRGGKGSSDITYDWRGASWRFKSEENRALFIANPNDYVPQYDGYCATAMSEKAVVKSDPKISIVFEDKLYLFYSKDARDTWKRSKKKRIERGNNYWQALSTGK